MPRELLTDWKRIGQSGYTADGRKIEAAWLVEMAETYDPKKYTALIWWEHYRFLGNLGKVVELTTQEENDNTILLARIAPNSKLIELNKQDQQLFTSMEITPDFAKTGKSYLSGLAATDSPASLGTQELKFTLGTDDLNRLFSQPIKISFNANGSENEAGFLKRIASHFGLTPHTQPQGDNEMTNEQFKIMQALFSTQTDALTQLTEQVKQFTSTGDESVDNSSDTRQDNQENRQKDNQQSIDFSSLENKLEAMEKSFSEFSSKLSTALGEQQGTDTPENNGESTEARCL